MDENGFEGLRDRIKESLESIGQTVDGCKIEDTSKCEGCQQVVKILDSDGIEHEFKNFILIGFDKNEKYLTTEIFTCANMNHITAAAKITRDMLMDGLEKTVKSGQTAEFIMNLLDTFGNFKKGPPKKEEEGEGVDEHSGTDTGPVEDQTNENSSPEKE